MNAINRTPARIVTAFCLTAAMLTPLIADATQTWWMRGGNWGDGRDNFQDGWIIPSGLTASSSISAAQSKAAQIATDIKGIGGNMMRIGINPASVSDAFWWERIKAYTDTLVANNVDVVLGYWEGGSSRDGLVDDMAKWKTMWQKVDAQYGSNSHVWFEPMNEPHGYAATDLKSLYRTFLGFVGKSDDRIILDGAGYSERVGDIADDPAFNNCKFGVHIYSYWATDTEAGWKTRLNNSVAGYWDRTLITEMGAPATTGLNFGTSSSNNDVSFIRGVTQRTLETTIGILYWPTHRDGDSYRLFKNTTGGGVTNTSLKDRLRYGWNY